MLRAAQATASAVVLGEADREGLSGEKIGELLRRRRLAALSNKGVAPLGNKGDAPL